MKKIECFQTETFFSSHVQKKLLLSFFKCTCTTVCFNKKFLDFLISFSHYSKKPTDDYFIRTISFYFSFHLHHEKLSKWNTLYHENGSSWKYVSSVKKCRSSQKRIFRAKYFFGAYTTYTTIISFHFFLSLKEMHMKMMFCIRNSKKS